MNLRTPYIESVILLYLEFLVQNGLKSCSIRNHVSILRDFFQMFNWPKSALISRKIQLFIRSVQINATVTVKIKGVFTLKCWRN